MRMRSRAASAASAVSAACRHRPQAPTPPAIPATSRPRIRCLQRVAGASPPRVDILDAVASAAAHQAICRVQADALPGRQSRNRLSAESLAIWFTTWTHRLAGPAPAIRDIRHRCGPHERTAGGTACSVHEARTARAHSPVTGLCRGSCRSRRKRTCASTLSMASRPARSADGSWTDAAPGIVERGPLTCHCLLVETAARRVLVDTGLGLRGVADPRGRLSARGVPGHDGARPPSRETSAAKRPSRTPQPVFWMPAAMPLTVDTSARSRASSSRPPSRHRRSSSTCNRLIGST